MIQARKWIGVFLFASLLNLVWENLHSVLYVHYRLHAITEFVLIHAALFDAVVIAVSIWALTQFPRVERRAPWVLVVWFVLFAVALEEYALATGRWMYAVTMPLVPILQVGVTPTVQLALTGWCAFLLRKRIFRVE
jgi:hypothetical protein